MKASEVLDIAARFETAGVRYLIAGGYAVVAHGYVRFTADLDVVLDFAPDNIRNAVRVLSDAGYRPSVPVGVEQIADPAERLRLIQEKGMRVLNFFHGKHPQSRVDLFVEEPFSFAPAAESALVRQTPDGTLLRFVDLERLKEMKRVAGRPKDLIDLEYLGKLDHDDER